MKKLFLTQIILIMYIGMMSGQTSISLTWLGQSTFLMKTGEGAKVLMDPVNPSMVKVDLSESVDLVTVSHEHGDHNYVTLAKGNPVILRGLSGSDYAKIDEVVKGIHVKSVASFHDNQGGAQRGKNAIFVFEMPGMRVVHLGDLGHLLTESQVKEIGNADIVLMPVGGGFTCDLPTAISVINQIKPEVLIPMHFSPADAPAGGFRLGTVEDFIKATGGAFEVKYAGHSETFASGKLPQKTTIVVLKSTE